MGTNKNTTGCQCSTLDLALFGCLYWNIPISKQISPSTHHRFISGLGGAQQGLAGTSGVYEEVSRSKPIFCIIFYPLLQTDRMDPENWSVAFGQMVPAYQATGFVPCSSANGVCGGLHCEVNDGTGIPKGFIHWIHRAETVASKRSRIDCNSDLWYWNEGSVWIRSLMLVSTILAKIVAQSCGPCSGVKPTAEKFCPVKVSRR